jgi:hypothetical protein
MTGSGDRGWQASRPDQHMEGSGLIVNSIYDGSLGMVNLRLLASFLS